MSEIPDVLAWLREFELSTVTTARSNDPIWLDRPSVRHVLSGVEVSEVEDLEDAGYDVIECPVVVNTQRELNRYFQAVHRKLVPGGYFTGRVETIEHRRQALTQRLPRFILPLVYLVDFVWRRVLPRVELTRGIHGRLFPTTRVGLSTAELLGRLVYCGFEIAEHRDEGEALLFTVRKAGAPMNGEYLPSVLLFRMDRLGKNGQPLRVYKIRTMHPYAQYLQEYLISRHGLLTNGKFSGDFRITGWGATLRKSFVDELPMLYNLVRGDVKIFGVRPISEQYASLYPEEVRKQRFRHKPGLVPPFYSDLPCGFDEIVASEKRYLDAYEARPLLTDMKYLCVALFNIVFRRARSA